MVPFLALSWLRTPFIDALVEHTLISSTVTPTGPDTWELNTLGPSFGYQVVAVNDNTFKVCAI